MNEAFPKTFFDALGLVSLLDQQHASAKLVHEPP